jgi:hypothetical protein
MFFEVRACLAKLGVISWGITGYFYMPLMFLFVLCTASSLNLSFRYSRLFIPEMPTGFTSYSVQIITIYFAWIL